jgi:ATP/maltotriose-dependent transcriptional regulator MalT
VAEGRRHESGLAARRLAVERAFAAGDYEVVAQLLELPSQAELAVLRLLTSDLSTREIGERLCLSANTIRTHTRALYRKLGVHSRTDAIARAATRSLLGHTQSPM